MTRLNKLPPGAKVKSSIGGQNYKKKAKSEVIYKPVEIEKEKEAKLIIPGELPTENEIIDKAKTHWAKYKKMKDTYDSLVKVFSEKHRVPFFETILLQITYYRKNRMYDPDNICSAKKFILDGLQKAGVIENDGWKVVKGFQETWEVDKDNPRTEVIIKEVED